METTTDKAMIMGTVLLVLVCLSACDQRATAREPARNVESPATDVSNDAPQILDAHTVKSEVHQAGPVYIFHLTANEDCVFTNACYEVHITDASNGETWQVLKLRSDGFSSLLNQNPLLEVTDVDNDGYRDIRLQTGEIWMYDKANDKYTEVEK